MLTIKWIGTNGSEMLYQGRDVSFTPGEAREDTKDAKALVSFNDDHGSHCTIDSGEIYVMNEAGRTVANYVLATKEFPHGIMPRQRAA